MATGEYVSVFYYYDHKLTLSPSPSSAHLRVR